VKIVVKIVVKVVVKIVVKDRAGIPVGEVARRSSQPNAVNPAGSRDPAGRRRTARPMSRIMDVTREIVRRSRRLSEVHDGFRRCR
jgi:hypothetical protein